MKSKIQLCRPTHIQINISNVSNDKKCDLNLKFHSENKELGTPRGRAGSSL